MPSGRQTCVTGDLDRSVPQAPWTARKLLPLSPAAACCGVTGWPQAGESKNPLVCSVARQQAATSWRCRPGPKGISLATMRPRRQGSRKLMMIINKGDKEWLVFPESRAQPVRCPAPGLTGQDPINAELPRLQSARCRPRSLNHVLHGNIFIIMIDLPAFPVYTVEFEMGISSLSRVR